MFFQSWIIDILIISPQNRMLWVHIKIAFSKQL